LYPTGSKPPLEKGLQRKSRHTDIKNPLNAPNCFIASMAYAEQLGVYLQESGKTGDINLL
jgi:hypothetical protein